MLRSEWGFEGLEEMISKLKKSLGLGFILFAQLLGAAQNGPVFYAREMPLELKNLIRPLNVESDFQEKFTLPEFRIEAQKSGQFRLDLAQSRAVFFSGMPEIPQVLKIFKIKRGRSATVSLENVVLEESATAVPLQVSPESFLWEPSHRLAFVPQAGQRYFPGKFFDSHESKGLIYVNLFPIQVDLQTGKVLKMVSADVKLAQDEQFVDFQIPFLLMKPSLIVTTEKLFPAATILKAYHENQLGIKTEVVTVEEIARTEVPIAEDDLPAGYKEPEGRDAAVIPFDPANQTGYHYELARKISAYLQKRMVDASPLRYVTLLGDGVSIPPSYYYASRAPFGRNFSPTDQCYGAVKKCAEPKVAVGRLPLISEEEVKTYIDKVERWRSFAETTNSELALYGGKAFTRSDVYIGELGTLDTIQSPKADWRGVKKIFKTNLGYDKSAVLDLVRGKNESAFAYYLDHGNGNQWYTNKEFVSSTEVMEAVPDKDQRPSLIVSIACTNAAFDEGLSKENILGAEKYGKQSVGVSLIRSKAGAVAYLGSARVALGMPIYKFDEFGNLNVSGSNFGLQLLEGFFERYGLARKGRLGDYSLKALQAFVFEYGNDFSKDQNAWSYFITELLGDPVIPLPTRKEGESNFEIASSTFKLDNALGVGLPLLHLKGQKELDFKFNLPGSAKASLFQVLKNDFDAYEGEKLVQTQDYTSAQIAQFPLKVGETLTEGTYFLRLENAAGVPRERQVHFTVTKD